MNLVRSAIAPDTIVAAVAGRGTGGFLHVKDSLAATARDAPFPSSARHPVVRLGIHTPLDDALTAMRAAGTHLVAVTSGTGAAVGYVTMEDVLQQLVGPSRPGAGGA